MKLVTFMSVGCKSPPYFLVHLIHRVKTALEIPTIISLFLVLHPYSKKKIDKLYIPEFDFSMSITIFFVKLIQIPTFLPNGD